MSEKKTIIVPAHATPAHPRAPQPHADSPDANGPGHPQEGVAETIHDAQTDHAAATHETVHGARQDAKDQQATAAHDAAAALNPSGNLEQLRGQLAAVRGLPQYADEERDLLKKIAALEGQTPHENEPK